MRRATRPRYDLGVVRDVPILTDGEIALRAWRDEDAGGVAMACSDPEVRRWLPVPNPYGEADGLEYIRGCRARWDRGPDAPFAIVARDTDRVLGSIDRHGPDGCLVATEGACHAISDT